jgi:hypothetical protein
MKAWSNFYPYILPKVPNAVLPVVDFELLHAAREWCDKTLCWRAWLDAVLTADDTVLYDFNVDVDQDVVQLVNATVDGTPLTPIRMGDLPADWLTSSCIEKSIFALPNGTQFGLIPQQAADIEVACEVILRPALTATSVTDEIFAAYAREISFGALGSLLPQSGARAQFERAIDDAATDIFRSMSQAPQRVRASFL